MPHIGEVLGLAIAPAPAAPGGGGGGGGSTVIKGSAVITVPPNSREFSGSISAPGVSSSMVAMIALAQHADADENSEEMIEVNAQRATAGTDSISLFMAFGEVTSGPVRINYMVS